MTSPSTPCFLLLIFVVGLAAWDTGVEAELRAAAVHAQPGRSSAEPEQQDQPSLPPCHRRVKSLSDRRSVSIFPFFLYQPMKVAGTLLFLIPRVPLPEGFAPLPVSIEERSLKVVSFT